MAVRLLVTVGTDGVTDWVKTPDGTRHNLGPVSVLNFVAKLVRDSRVAKQTLDAFLREGSAMLKVDQDRMWALLAPRRSRWAADGPFIAPDQREGPQRKGTMATLNDDLQALEQHIQALDRAAAANTNQDKMAEGHQILANLAQGIRSPGQSDNGAYYGLSAPAAPTPDVFTATDEATPPTAPVAAPAGGSSVGGLSYDTYAVNTALANDIITKAELTNDKIDLLVQAGKKFAADKAKADLHAVTSKVAGILENVDLTVPWVHDDLQKLASRANELHGLFAPAKV